MSRVLERTTRLLEALAERPAWHLSELAVRVDLPPATTARLLASLVELAWADQIAPRGAYRLGPRAEALAERRPYLGRLVTAARPLLADLAHGLGQGAVLTCLAGDQRRVLLLRTPHHAVPVSELPVADRDLYATASGRLLLAHLAPRPRNRLFDRLGPPAKTTWPGLLDRRELLAELRLLRRTGLSEDRSGQWHALAAWAGNWDGHGTAVGSFAPPGQLHPDTAGRLRTTAATLAAYSSSIA